MIASIRQYLGLVSYRRLEQDATGGEIPEKTIFYPPGSSKYLSYLYLLFALVFLSPLLPLGTILGLLQIKTSVESNSWKMLSIRVAKRSGGV